MHRMLVLSLLAATAATAVASAQEPGQLDRSGARLLAERAGGSVCLALVAPGSRPIRGCLLAATPGRIRLTYAGRACDTSVRAVGIAPRGTAKVNLAGVTPGDGPDRPIALKLLRIPASVHPARGVAFAVRRSVEGTSPRFTAYNAAGRRLAQRQERFFPFIDCVQTEVSRPARG